MDKLKNILKSDTPTDQPSYTGNTGRVSGQGSHFPSKDGTSVNAPGATAPGLDPSTQGPSDVSAAPTSSTVAATTAGPEQGGKSHVNTVSATEPAAQQSAGGVADYTVGSADFPKTETSADGSGSAAVGQTSTYSSSHLARGDPTSSIVDPNSSDPLTYKKPESGLHSEEVGVGAGAAATAASLAFTQGQERKAEEMSGYDNPYRTASLDPRVDGGSKASAPVATSMSSTLRSSAPHTEAEAPSTLSTTADPADRSTEYGATTHEKGLSSADTSAPVLPAPATSENEPSMVGKVLGAVGLGGVASSLGRRSASKDASAIADTPEQPTTVTGLETYTAPTQQGAPVSHHRKESIPTTAYPSGTFDSPRAINQPVGGAGSPVVHGDQERASGHSALLGTAAGGATAGAVGVGAHEYEKSQSLRENITSDTQGTAPALKEPGDTSALSGVDSSRYAESQALRENISGQPISSVPFAHHATTMPESETSHGLGTSTIPGTDARTAGMQGTTEPIATAPSTIRAGEQDHTTRDTALGAGAGAAAVGAGAYGAHEYSKREAENAEREAARDQAAREKEIAREQAAHEKELEKQHKAEEKAAEKEEKKHQKEIEKEEKKHQKEIEKEEKRQEKEAEAAAVKEQREREKEKARIEKQQAEEEEERRNRAERERLAGAAGIGGAAAAGEHEHEKEVEKEKKPNIFKRIFKRRKNKDTGEEEDYESEEEHKDHKASAAAAAGGFATAGGAGAAAYAAEHDKTTHPTTTDVKPDASTYEQQSGGVQKPSYNPLSKNETPIVTSAPNEPGPTTAVAPATTDYTGTHSQQPATAVTGVPYDSAKDSTAVAGTAPATIENTGTRSQQPTEAITGLPYDASKDPQAAARLGEHSHGEGVAQNDPLAGHHDQPTEAITGLPYDASKDPQAAARLQEHGHGEGIGSLEPTAAERAEEGYQPPTNFTLGQVEGKHDEPTTSENTATTEEVHHGSGAEHTGIAQQVKDSFHMGGL